MKIDFSPKQLIDDCGGIVAIRVGTYELISCNPGVDNVVHQLRKLDGWANFTRRTLDNAINEAIHCRTDGSRISEMPSFTLWLDGNPNAKKSYDDLNNENSRKVGDQTKKLKDKIVQNRKCESRVDEDVDDREPEPSKKAKVKQDGTGKSGKEEVEKPKVTKNGAGFVLSESHLESMRCQMRQKQLIERLGGHFDLKF